MDMQLDSLNWRSSWQSSKRFFTLHSLPWLEWVNQTNGQQRKLYMSLDRSVSWQYISLVIASNQKPRKIKEYEEQGMACTSSFCAKDTDLRLLHSRKHCHRFLRGNISWLGTRSAQDYQIRTRSQSWRQEVRFHLSPWISLQLWI